MKKIFSISGMHCVSCEALLEQEVCNISGIKKAKASYKKEVLEIEIEKEIDKTLIQKAVEKCGYSLGKNSNSNENDQCRNSRKDYIEIGVIVISLLFLFSFLEVMNISQFFPDVPEGIGFGIAFLIGIIASFSTCLALTGGIVMSFSSEYQLGSNASIKTRAQPQVFFQIGRIGGFFLFGGVLGLLGAKIQYSVGFTGFLTILVSVLMLYIGLHVLKIAPSPASLGLHLPKGMEKYIASLRGKKHPFFPAIIGMLTFFLPCGFTQSMQIAAVASGSFLTGGLIMASFAIGTFPVLFGVGMGTSYATEGRKKQFFKKMVGVLIAFFGLYSLHSGLVLSGVSIPDISFRSFFHKNEIREITPKEESENMQLVSMDINYVFEPSKIRIKKGIPVKWEIHAKKVGGCTDEVIIPSLGLSTGKLINGDTAVIEFTPEKSGTIPFSCWMGMVTGEFIVE